MKDETVNHRSSIHSLISANHCDILNQKSSLLSLEADLMSPSAGINVSPSIPNLAQNPKYPLHCISKQIHSISHSKQSIHSGNKIAAAILCMFLQSQCHSGQV